MSEGIKEGMIEAGEHKIEKDACFFKRTSQPGRGLNEMAAWTNAIFKKIAQLFFSELVYS